MLNREQIDYLLSNAFNASLRAGASILDIYMDDAEDISIDMKSDHTPLIKADLMAHTTIKDYLGSTHIPLLSEEGRDLLYEERCGWDLFWMVDPLDGTKEFLKGNGEFTVNIAVLHENLPVIGVIYVPYKRKIYYAVKGYGSWMKADVVADHQADYSADDLRKDAVRLPLADTVNNPVRVAISRSHNTPETFDRIEGVKRVYPDIIVVEQGSSYKLCLLAEATVDTYFRTSDTYEWDTAAGDVILTEAGGSIKTLDGDYTFGYNKSSLLNPHFVCRSKFF